MEIKIAQNEFKGKAYVGEEKKPLAEMTFTMAGHDKMIIDHTEVGDLLKGKGVGKLMLMTIVEKARQENIKILPLCPFVKSVFQKDKTLKDVLV